MSSAVLIVSGAWHVPTHYEEFAQALESKGIQAINPSLPTNNNADPPNKGLEDDITFIRGIVQEEIAKGTALTVMCHSYGGVVVTGALGDMPTKASNNQGYVARIIYVTAFVPKEGQSLGGIFGGQLPPFFTVSETGILDWKDPIPLLYNDLTPEKAQWAENLRVKHSNEAQFTDISNERPAAWRKIPVAYIKCEIDQGIPVSVQEMLIGNVKSEGCDIEEYSIKAGHSPFLSQPEGLADLVKTAMKL